MNKHDQILTFYQEISRERELPALLRSVLRIILENTPADHVYLLSKLPRGYALWGKQKQAEAAQLWLPARALQEGELPLEVFERMEYQEQVLQITPAQMATHFEEESYFKERHPEAAVCIPLWEHGQLLGYLYAEVWAQWGSFSEHDLSLLSALAPQISLRLQQLSEEIAPAAQPQQIALPSSDSAESTQLEQLHQIGKLIANSPGISEMTEVVYEQLRPLMDVYAFDIGIYNPDNHLLEFPGTIEDGHRLEFNTIDVESEQSLAALCFRYQQEVFLQDVFAEYENYFPGKRPTPKVGEAVINSLLYMPISLPNKPLGVLTVQSQQRKAYSPQQLTVLRNILPYLAIALNALSLKRDYQIEQQAFQQQRDAQRQEIDHAYETVKRLAEIGQDITSNLSVGEIIETVYENINGLLDAPYFSIGIYNSKYNRLEMPAAIEQGQRMPAFHYDLQDEEKLSVRCLRYLQEIVILDLEQEAPERWQRLEQESGHPRSLVYLPLIGKEGGLGVITVQSPNKQAYSAQDLNVLRNLAVYAGIALDNALVYEGMEELIAERTAEVVSQKEELEASRDQIEQTYRNIKLLSEVGFQITTSFSCEDIIGTMYQQIHNLMDATAFGIGIYEEQKQHIAFRGGMERGHPLPEFVHDLKDDDRLSVWCFKNKQEVFILDYDKDYKRYLQQHVAPKAGMRMESVIYLPLEAKGKVIGVITVQSENSQAYTPNHISLLRNLAIYAAIALDNAQTYATLQRQHHEIQHNSQKVNASIKYAKRIQTALLPNRAHIDTLLPDSFVFFKPRDIVSGDFFWFAELRGKLFVAAVDCTGHGVPGAFMSVIGNSLLNEVVNVRGIEDPSEVLDYLHAHVASRLNQHDNEVRDGMDISLCVIDRTNKQLQYAGAKSPLIRICGGELQEIKGDRLAIGGLPPKQQQGSYTTHTFSLQEDATYYIFSDGYQDQFGGPEGRKFLYKRFKELLLEISPLPMEQQRKQLRRKLNDWMQKEPMQTDDILVIGFRA